jgi:hypothetical protein
MKIYVGVSLFEYELEDIKENPADFWLESLSLCGGGIVVGLRGTGISASGLKQIEFEVQCKRLQRLLDSRPPKLSLILGPHDGEAMEEVVRVQREAGKVDAIWLPPAAAHQPELVQKAAGLGVPLLAAVNGLGPQGFKALQDACKGALTTLCYIAAEGEAISSMLMQLAWLRAQKYPVGLVADDKVELQSAAALGADVLVPSRARAFKEDWQGVVVRLRRIAEAARGDGPRPITREEMDGLRDEVPVLVAARRLEPGKTIVKEDIKVRVVGRRGLGPFMMEAIVGRELRYGLDPGEPFSFGFLKEPESHD